MMAALLLMATPASVATAGDIRGDWVNQRGTAIIRIDNCASGLCGTVVWSAPTAQRDAIRGGTADLNGSIVMSGFVRATERRWRGTLFLPDQNRMVKALVQGILAYDRMLREEQSAYASQPGHDLREVNR